MKAILYTPSKPSDPIKQKTGEDCSGTTCLPLPEYTYEDGEWPKCPFCGTEWIVDDPMYYDEQGYEDECPECGNHIRVEPIISVAWRTIPIRWANEKSPDAGATNQ